MFFLTTQKLRTRIKAALLHIIVHNCKHNYHKISWLKHIGKIFKEQCHEKICETAQREFKFKILKLFEGASEKCKKSVCGHKQPHQWARETVTLSH